MSLPPFEIFGPSNQGEFITQSLGVLFEESPILEEKLVPALIQTISLNPESPPKSYSDLVDLSLSQMNHWTAEERASFIAGHPRIGEVSNLSALSAAEQSSRKTPPEVLTRLEYLNAQYEHAYPGLRYITFVNGRTRGEIATEMEGVLELENGKMGDVKIHGHGSEKWNSELNRAVADVGLIAKARLKGMGLS